MLINSHRSQGLSVSNRSHHLSLSSTPTQGSNVLPSPQFWRPQCPLKSPSLTQQVQSEFSEISSLSPLPLTSPHPSFLSSWNCLLPSFSTICFSLSSAQGTHGIQILLFGCASVQQKFLSQGLNPQLLYIYITFSFILYFNYISRHYYLDFSEYIGKAYMVLKENWVKNWKTLEMYFLWTSTFR